MMETRTMQKWKVALGAGAVVAAAVAVYVATRDGAERVGLSE